MFSRLIPSSDEEERVKLFDGCFSMVKCERYNIIFHGFIDESVPLIGLERTVLKTRVRQF